MRIVLRAVQQWQQENKPTNTIHLLLIQPVRITSAYPPSPKSYTPVLSVPAAPPPIPPTLRTQRTQPNFPRPKKNIISLGIAPTSPFSPSSCRFRSTGAQAGSCRSRSIWTQVTFSLGYLTASSASPSSPPPSCLHAESSSYFSFSTVSLPFISLFL